MFAVDTKGEHLIVDDAQRKLFGIANTDTTSRCIFGLCQKAVGAQTGIGSMRWASRFGAGAQLMGRLRLSTLTSYQIF